MRSQLWGGIIALLMSIIMVVCIVVDIVMANWPALIICTVALFLNGSNAIACFRRYRTMKNLDKLHSTVGVGFISD